MCMARKLPQCVVRTALSGAGNGPCGDDRPRCQGKRCSRQICTSGAREGPSTTFQSLTRRPNDLEKSAGHGCDCVFFIGYCRKPQTCRGDVLILADLASALPCLDVQNAGVNSPVCQLCVKSVTRRGMLA